MIDELKHEQGSKRPGAMKLAGRLLLVLEDEPLILRQTTRALQHAGASVLRARTAKSASIEIDRNRIDGAVLDVNLGYGKTCAEIAHTLRMRDIPFCLFSGDFRGANELVSSLGAPLIQKPTSDRSLVAEMSKLFRRT